MTANLPENMGAFIFLLQKSQIKEVPPIIDVEGFVECIRYCADDDNVFGEAAALKAFDAKDFEEVLPLRRPSVKIIVEIIRRFRAVDSINFRDYRTRSIWPAASIWLRRLG